jgi:hypothetical protein
MRTGIYVYSATTFTFSASEPLIWTSYSNQQITVDATSMQCTLAPGIYKAVTNAMVSVSGGTDSTRDLVASPNNKDPWPEPPNLAKSTFGIDTPDTVSFFAVPDAKSAAF